MLKVTQSLQKILFTAVFLFALISLHMAFGVASKVSAAPIPVGCPGSTIVGPPTQAETQKCATIPIGCPGSTQQGPVSTTPANCPYDSPATTTPSDTSDCSQTSTAAKTVVCAPHGCDYKDATGCHDCNVKSDTQPGSTDGSSCNLFKYINFALSLAAGLVGIIATILIIIGGIQYSLAGSDPNNVAKAKKRISNGIGILVGFALLYAIIQYLVPGGLF